MVNVSSEFTLEWDAYKIHFSLNVVNLSLTENV